MLAEISISHVVRT